MRVAVAMALLLLTACPGDKKPMPDGGHVAMCMQSTDCDAGFICASGGFCDNCSSSGQCRTRETCDATAKLCQLRMGWGDMCSTNDQCQAGDWCKQGLCADRADVQLCPSGLDSECPQGQRCNQINTVCEEDLGCTSDADCGAQEACNIGSRQCQPRCTMETQSTVCPAATKCVGEICAQCATNSDCGAGLGCDQAGNCSSGARCYSDRDCTVPLVCFLQTGSCLPASPPCMNDDNCPSDKRCDVPSGQCLPRTCQPDRYEPDDDMTHAYGITQGRYDGLTLCTADLDWYSINLSRGDQLGVNIDADPFSENNFSALVKDPSGRTVAAGHFLTSYVASSPQKYFVVISTNDNYQPYDVTFLLSRGSPCDDDSNEPNDSPAQATSLNSSNLVDGQICPQDEDWFKVSVPAGMGVNAQLVNYDSSKGLLRLCAFPEGDDGGMPLSCDDSTMPAVTFDGGNPDGGAFNLYLRVNGETDKNANGYTLKVEL
ncbi:MAG: hypothetical protein QM723_28005 [Myxococcaceae bacterium]